MKAEQLNIANYNDRLFTSNNPALNHGWNMHNADHSEMDQDYWILRDTYGRFINPGGMIPTIPADAESDNVAQDKLPRICETIRAFDNNVGIMSNKKKFSFTREINPKGSYYLTKEKIFANKDKPIHVIVNELEGLNQPNQNFTQALPEYFHLLYVPINPPIKWIRNVTTYKGQTGDPVLSNIPLVNITTKLHVRLRATWEGFDYNHEDNPGGDTPHSFATDTSKIIDPLYSAELDYKSNLVQMENK